MNSQHKGVRPWRDFGNTSGKMKGGGTKRLNVLVPKFLQLSPVHESLHKLRGHLPACEELWKRLSFSVWQFPVPDLVTDFGPLHPERKPVFCFSEDRVFTQKLPHNASFRKGCLQHNSLQQSKVSSTLLLPIVETDFGPDMKKPFCCKSLCL